MSGHDIRSAKRPAPDQVLKDIADYVCDYKVKSSEAYKTARYMLMDTLGLRHAGPGLPGLHQAAGAGGAGRHAAGRRPGAGHQP